MAPCEHQHGQHGWQQRQQQHLQAERTQTPIIYNVQPRGRTVSDVVNQPYSTWDTQNMQLHWTYKQEDQL
jgi:hypothetical protein